jgi:predicted permease
VSDHPRPSRVARLVARCYPRELRAQYAEDIARFIDDQRHDPARGGTFRRLQLAALLSADAARSLTAALLRRRPPEPPAAARWAPPLPPPPSEPFMETLLQDIRFACRTFLRRPGFTAIALLTLCLGIGANSAIFTLVNAVLIRPLPFAHPEQLAVIWGMSGGQRQLLSIPDVEEMRARTRVFQEIGLMRTQSVNLTGTGEPDRLIGSFISAATLHLLGARPALGRLFTPDETALGHGQPVAVLSYQAWKSRFGGEPDVVGRTLVLNGRPHQVIGVASAGLLDSYQSDVWLPITSAPNPAWFTRPATTVWALGRMKPGFTPADGERDLGAIAADLARTYPVPGGNPTIAVVDLHESITGGSRFMLIVLFGAVGAVLLIVCVNIANLQLARATTRDREMSLRAALGAGRGRLIRQVLTESLLLSLIGGALGLLVGRWALGVLVASLPGGLPITTPLTLDATTVLFSIVVAVATGVFFGAPAAWHGARAGLHDALRGGAQTGSVRRIDARSVLVAAELALCIVLLASAGLFTRSLVALQRARTGFDPAHVLTAEFRLPSVKYDDSVKVITFMSTVLERLRAIPGVQSAALVDAVPLSGNFGSIAYVPEGEPRPAPADAPSAGINLVSDGYFRTLGIPLIAGRDVAPTDRLGTEPVIVVNQAFADRVWPGQPAVGHRVVLIGPPDITARVVGVVGTTTQMTLSETPLPQIFAPKLQAGGIFASIALRGMGDEGALTRGLQQAVWSVDRDQPVWKIRSLESLVERDLSPARFTVGLIGAFAALALLLGIVGVYGVMSFVVTQRTREVGIRMALGAEAGQVVRLIVRRGAAVVAVAVAIGVAGALAAGRYLESRLYQVGGADPVTMVAVPIVLAAAALAACWLPARRLARVNPAVTLRTE